MTSLPSPPTCDPPSVRVAGVHLRDLSHDRVTRLYAPVPGPRHPWLVVFFPDQDLERLASGDRRCRDICAQHRVLLLASVASSAGEADAWRVVGWAADHVDELGVTSRTLLVCGDGTGSRLARSVTRRARADGWPSLTLLTPEDLAAGELHVAARTGEQRRGSGDSTRPPPMEGSDPP